MHFLLFNRSTYLAPITIHYVFVRHCVLDIVLGMAAEMTTKTDHQEVTSVDTNYDSYLEVQQQETPGSFFSFM